MRLWEETVPDESALPLVAFKAHLRLGEGFAEDLAEDALLKGYLRAALGAIETQTGKAILQREFRVEVEHWRDPAGQALPIAPVSEVASVQVIDALEVVVTVAESRWRLDADLHRPKVTAQRVSLTAIPPGGRGRIRFTAGFGAWEDVPPALAQAVLLLAASYYEDRQGATLAGFSRSVEALIAPYRNVRILAGGGS